MSNQQSGYAPVNGLNLYYELHGEGFPLVVLHGGLGATTMFGDVLGMLATDRQVIAVDLQSHGRTADTDRPMRYELMADDIGALISYLGHTQADVLGYSLGGGVALRTAIQYPALVRKLLLVSTPFSNAGWYPEIRNSMAGMSGGAAPFMTETPMYQTYTALAPNVDHFPRLLDKIGECLRQEYDWADAVAKLTMPTLLVYGDADSIPPSHAARFFELLGGGLQDADWDGAKMSRSRLAILPATTHYNVFISPLMVQLSNSFLAEPVAA